MLLSRVSLSHMGAEYLHGSIGVMRVYVRYREKSPQNESRCDAFVCCSFGDGTGHMAFNYWFHPPDASPPNFDRPYVCDFWERDWEARDS